MLKKTKNKSLIALALAAVFLTGCELLPVEETFRVVPIVKDYEVEEYQQTTVQRGDLLVTERVNCKYIPAKSESLAFPVSGHKIHGIYVTVGQQVSAGELLAELEEGNLEAQIEALTYQVQTLQIQISHLEQNQTMELDRHGIQENAVQRQLDTVDERLVQISERLQQIEAQLQQAGSQETQPAESQNPQLLAEQAGLLQEQEILLQNQKILNQEQVNLKQARSAIENTYQKQFQSLEDTLYIAQLRLNAAQTEHKQRQIYAGIDGTVTFVRTVSDGTVSTEELKLIEISDMDTMAFVVQGDNADYFPIGTQTVVTSKKTEYPVESVEASQLGLPEPAEGEKIAYLHLLQPDAALEDGDAGYITVILEQSLDTLYVESTNVHFADGRHFVYVLNEDGLRVMQDVTVGLEAGNYIEITSGLAEGDSVIIG